jgi:hypothetical protein
MEILNVLELLSTFVFGTQMTQIWQIFTN